MIGLFDWSFNKRSVFVYKSKSEIKGLFINTRNWKALENDHPKFMAAINLKAANHYMKVY